MAQEPEIPGFFSFFVELGGFQSAIASGYEIDISEAPYQVNYGDICGGVLIHSKWVLTSAHCGTQENFIRVGSKHRLKNPQIRIALHLLHPNFGQSHAFDFDVQLLRLYRSLRLNIRVQVAKISEDSFDKHVWVSGWGYSKEKTDYNDILQQVELQIISMRQCQGVNNTWYNHTLTKRMFCAGGFQKDACQGDSGGGAVSSGRVIGISSFGFGCGRNIPGVYTNVSDHNIRHWIKKHTGV